MSAHNDIDAWSLLYNPPSIHEASHTLAEMLLNIPVEDRDHFAPLGEASVCMPLRVMEKYLYPTIKHYTPSREHNRISKFSKPLR